MTAAPSFCENRKLIGKKRCLALFTLTTLAVVAAFIYVLVEPPHKRNGGSKADSPVTTGAGNASTTVEEGAEDIANTANPMSRIEAVSEVLKEVTEMDTLMDTGTPQNMALEWLATHDSRQVDPQHADLIQRYALATLFFSTTGASWKDTKENTVSGAEERSSNWLTPIHECDWDFTTCVGHEGEQKFLRIQKDNSANENQTTSFVNDGNLAQRILVGLNLQARNLMGQIPREIGVLDTLVSLHLGSNELVGELPVTMGGLSNLEIMRLGTNHLHGAIPESFADLTNLEIMTLNDNRFGGEIPAFLGNLTNLVELRLGGNYFSGVVPREICSLETFEAAFVQPLPNATCTCCNTEGSPSDHKKTVVDLTEAATVTTAPPTEPVATESNSPDEAATESPQQITTQSTAGKLRTIRM